MKNPWMRLWLNAVNSSLDATRAFWAGVLRQRQTGERDRPSDASEARAAEEPKATSPRPPEARAAEPAESSAARPTTSALEEPGVKTSRKSNARAPDASRATSASEASSKAKRRRPAEPSKVATEKRTPSQKKPKTQSPAAKKAGKSEPKYRNPDDPSQTWSGRGRRPRWVTQALEAGRTLDELQAGKS